jgi:hypothetical protein
MNEIRKSLEVVKLTKTKKNVKERPFNATLSRVEIGVIGFIDPLIDLRVNHVLPLFWICSYIHTYNEMSCHFFSTLFFNAIEI